LYLSLVVLVILNTKTFKITLVDIIKKNPTSLKYVGYGGTELLSPEEFLSQLIETGDTSKKDKIY